jgi:hypothetical protein
MRTSILSRSVVAVASLAIGSVALAAAPATATTPSGITRDMVLTAAASVRADQTNDVPYSDATKAALLALSSRACDLSGATEVLTYGGPVETPGSADALMVETEIYVGDSIRGCSFAAIASTDPELRLSGHLALTDRTYVDSIEEETTTSYDISGPVFTTPPLKLDDSFSYSNFKAVGSTVGSTKVLNTDKVPDKKTKSDKALAHKKYKTRVTNAKRAYAKALKKADSTSETRAAKRAYRARKAIAKAKHTYAIANYKIVKVRTTQDIVRPFSVRVDPAT